MPMPDDVKEKDKRELRCHDCGGVLACCEFCDSEECQKPICYGCVIVALGESVPQPHSHGG